MTIIVSAVASIIAVGVMVLAVRFLRGNPSSPRTAMMDHRRSTQIVVEWPSADVGLLRLWMLENRLERHAGDAYRVDGHDIGSGTANVFLYAGDPDSAVRRVIALHDQRRLKSGMRIGVAENDNADRTDWTYRPFSPPGLAAFHPFSDVRRGAR
jgi:hypothetical protein